MDKQSSLIRLADDIARAIPAIDAETTGQYGDGLGSEDEEQQVKLLLEELRDRNQLYREVDREVQYPDRSASCDLLLPDGIPVECKLLRYWRANGDPEHAMFTHVFSPFNENTLLTDAKRLHESDLGEIRGLLGLFYKRADDDPEDVRALPERFTAEDFAEKIVQDIEHWYGIKANVCNIAKFSGLQHPVHKQGAAITWKLK